MERREIRHNEEHEQMRKEMREGRTQRKTDIRKKGRSHGMYRGRWAIYKIQKKEDTRIKRDAKKRKITHK